MTLERLNGARSAAPECSAMPVPMRAELTAPTYLLVALTVAVTLAFTLFIETRAPLRDDVAWMIYLAENWLDGGRPYGPLVEVNPPTMVWLSMPPVLLARVLNVSVLTLTPLFFAASVLVCAWITAETLRRRAVYENAAVVFGLLSVTLLLLPLSEFGEREHLIAAAALPYLALHAGRLPASGTGRGEAVLAGLLAGICCGMKPHYALPFLLVSGWSAFSGRRLPWLCLVITAATVLALAVATLLLTPAYLNEVVPLALRLYAPLPSTPMLPVAAQPAVIALVGAVLLRVALRPRLQDGGIVDVLLVFALASWMVYLVQYKGFFYQRIPGTVATFLALAAWTVAARASFRGRPAFAVATVLLLLGSVAHAGVRGVMRVQLAADPDVRPEARMAEYLRSRGASSYVAYTYYLSWGFPLVQSAGVSWALRYPSTWALRAEHEQAIGQPHRSPIETSVRRLVVEDFLAGCPDLVAVGENEGMDYLAVLAAEGHAFTAAWAHYRPIGQINQFRIYARPRESTKSSVCGGDAPPDAPLPASAAPAK